ncbi:hypothetical protein GCM10023197_45830 [Gordonia humi]
MADTLAYLGTDAIIGVLATLAIFIFPGSRVSRGTIARLAS